MPPSFPKTILEVQTISPVFKWAVLAASVALYAGMSLYLIRKCDTQSFTPSALPCCFARSLAE